jgi:hypothetical protein
LKLVEGILTIFSKCPLKSLNNQADFDSAIRRFDPSRPSHRLRLTASDTQPLSSARRYRNSGSSCTTAPFRILSPLLAAGRLSSPHSS